MQYYSVCRKMTAKNGIASIIVILSLVFILSGCSEEKNSSVTSVPGENTGDNVDYTTLYEELFNPPIGEQYAVIVTDSADVAMNLNPNFADSTTILIEGAENYIVANDSLVSAPVSLDIRCRFARFIRGQDSSRVSLVFICKPEGLIFDDSLLLDIDPSYFNNNPNSNVVKLYIYNETNNRWMLEAVSHKSNMRLRYRIAHFSKYAISD